MRRKIQDEIEQEDDPFAAFAPEKKFHNEEFNLEDHKELVSKLIKVLNFAKQNPWHDQSFYLKCLEVIEKGYNMANYQVQRINRAYDLLIENEYIQSASHQKSTYEEISKEDPNLQI